MLSSVSGNVTDSMLIQFLNAPGSIVFNPSGRSIDVNDVQSLKAHFPMFVNPVGNPTVFSALQFSNALSPIPTTRDPMVISDREVQF